MPQEYDKKIAAKLSAKQSFWIATNGPVILKKLCGEQQQTYKIVFDEAIVKKIQLYQFIEKNAQPSPQQKPQADILAPVVQAFFAVAGQPFTHFPTLNWITDQFLTGTMAGHTILAEDLAMIGRNISYFNSLKMNGFFKDVHVCDYKNIDCMEQDLKPHKENRARKHAGKAGRTLTPVLKNLIMSETTILYEGTEGRIVLPHTLRASRFWGNNTKWCISGVKDGPKTFPSHNSDSPIFMILPRKGQKIAVTGEDFWNEEDHIVSKPEKIHSDMLERMLEGMDSLSRLYIENLMPLGYHTDPAPEDQGTNATTFTQEDIVNACDDHMVIMKAVEQDGTLLEFASQQSRKNYGIVMTAIGNTIAALEFVDESLLQNDEFLIEAMFFNPDVIRTQFYEGRQNDPDFMTKAIRREERLFVFLGPELNADRNFIENIMREFPLVSLKIREYGNPANLNDLEILAYQIQALKTLTLSDLNMEAAWDGLRFIKPLWGMKERIFGEPRKQIAYLEKIGGLSKALRESGPIPPNSGA